MLISPFLSSMTLFVILFKTNKYDACENCREKHTYALIQSQPKNKYWIIFGKYSKQHK